jgi:hypothetical protein
MTSFAVKVSRFIEGAIQLLATTRSALGAIFERTVLAASKGLGHYSTETT